jgi:hypothetical protein
MPGNEDEAAELLDAYLDRVTVVAARAAVVSAWIHRIDGGRSVR